MLTWEPFCHLHGIVSMKHTRLEHTPRGRASGCKVFFFFFFLLDFLRRDHFMTSIGTKSGDGVFVNHPNKRWESRILMESANQCAFKNNWTLYFLRFSGRPIEDLFYFFFPTCKQQVDDSCTGGKKNNDFFFLMTCSYQLKFLFLHNPSPWACFSLV